MENQLSVLGDGHRSSAWILMESNPYRPAVNEPYARSSNSSVFHPANPYSAAATWFVGVAVVHFAALNWIAFCANSQLPIYTPLLLLLISAGLYLRVDFLRQLVVFVGSVFIAFATLLLPLNAAGIVSADTISYGRLKVEAPAPWVEIVFLLSVVITFAYPVYVLYEPLQQIGERGTRSDASKTSGGDG